MQIKDVAVNCGMFRIFVEAAKAAGLSVKHVRFLSGTKWYSEQPWLSLPLLNLLFKLCTSYPESSCKIKRVSSMDVQA
jgi:hypothetical protein